jgi:hypothetical protein
MSIYELVYLSGMGLIGLAFIAYIFFDYPGRR